jgi:hypothetical protein
MQYLVDSTICDTGYSGRRSNSDVPVASPFPSANAFLIIPSTAHILRPSRSNPSMLRPISHMSLYVPLMFSELEEEPRVDKSLVPFIRIITNWSISSGADFQRVLDRLSQCEGHSAL